MDPLNKRFKAFISQLSSAEVIDGLKLPDEFTQSERADFMIENRRAIIELKSLEVDPEYKVHSELEKYKKRDEYPLFYGEMDVLKILKHLPEGEQIKNTMFYKISRSIEKSFRKADKQIGATKEIFACPEAFGIMVLLNENISIFSPQLISYRVSQMLTKARKDGRPYYENIASVWFISENFALRSKKDVKLFPSIVIDGPSAANQRELTRIFEILQRDWAAFNGFPFCTINTRKISDADFIGISEFDKEKKSFGPRHEIWNKQYGNNPYLRTVSDEALLCHGTKLLKFMAPGLMKDGIKIPYDQMSQFTKGFSDFLEEARFRGLDLKKMRDGTIINQ